MDELRRRGLAAATALVGTSVLAQRRARAQADRERLGGHAGQRSGGASIQAGGGGQRIIRVGARAEILFPSIAAELARDGDIVEIESGVYQADVAIWKQKRLTIRAVGGPVRMVADGKYADGKGIWVLRDGEFDISGIQFEGARVPDRNGAGIRFERGRLRLEDCRFIDNQNGVLTGNDPGSEIRVHRCQFSGMFDKPSSGHYHNLYVGGIARCEVTASYFSRAQVGHLLKSRAGENLILHNRLTDEDGRASYELEFPNGGRALVLGNLIVQEAASENGGIVSFGAEGYREGSHELLMAYNTVVNRRARGATFVRVFPGRTLALLQNNLFVGRGDFTGVVIDPADGNVLVPDERQFVDPAGFDFHLRPDSPLRGKAVPPAAIGERQLTPGLEYRHPRDTRPVQAGGRTSPGAFQS